MEVLIRCGFDGLPYSLVIELMLEGEEESKVNESVVVKVGHNIKESSS